MPQTEARGHRQRCFRRLQAERQCRCGTDPTASTLRTVLEVVVNIVEATVIDEEMQGLRAHVESCRLEVLLPKADKTVVALRSTHSARASGRMVWLGSASFTLCSPHCCPNRTGSSKLSLTRVPTFHSASHVHRTDFAGTAGRTSPVPIQLTTVSSAVPCPAWTRKASCGSSCEPSE